MLQPRLIQPLVILISVIFSITLFADTNLVSSITVKGNKTVSTTRITLMLRTKVNQLFDEQIWKKDIESLMKTGFFSQVKYEIKQADKGLDITLFLDEYPQIERLKFEGLVSFKKKELEEIIRIKKGDYCTEDLVSDAVEKIKKVYQDKKIFYTDISADIIPSGENRVVLLFKIDEGEKRLYVREISFQGNLSFKSDILRRKMKTRERKFPFLRGSFIPDVFEQDIERIKRFYNNNGYLECEVEKEISTSERWVNIKIVIKEGHRFYFGKTEFSGNLLFDKKKLNSLLEYREGDPYSLEI